MNARTRTFAGAVALAIAWAGTALHAQQATADLVLTNGKIITVDEKFTIAQAVAVKGDRIIAVGTTQQINALAGPNTRRVDLKGKAVLPGLIDNHAHLWRAAATWEEELRLDGVDARKKALAMLCLLPALLWWSHRLACSCCSRAFTTTGSPLCSREGTGNPPASD